MEVEKTAEEIQAMESELKELRSIKSSSTKVQDELKQKEEEWSKERQRLETESNPNWAKARKAMDTMKMALKEKGVETDDDGNVVSNPQHVDVEKIRQEAVSAAQGVVLGSRVEDLLSEFDEESGKVVRHFYGKLIVGETVTLQNIGKFMGQAENAARSELGGNFKKTATQYSGGQGPRYQERESGKLDDASAKDLATRLGIKIPGMEAGK